MKHSCQWVECDHSAVGITSCNTVLYRGTDHCREITCCQVGWITLSPTLQHSRWLSGPHNACPNPTRGCTENAARKVVRNYEALYSFKKSGTPSFHNNKSRLSIVHLISAFSGANTAQLGKLNIVHSQKCIHQCCRSKHCVWWHWCV